MINDNLVCMHLQHSQRGRNTRSLLVQIYTDSFIFRSQGMQLCHVGHMFLNASRRQRSCGQAVTCTTSRRQLTREVKESVFLILPESKNSPKDMEAGGYAMKHGSQSAARGFIEHLSALKLGMYAVEKAMVSKIIA